MNKNQNKQQSIVIWVIGGLLLLFLVVTWGLAFEMREQLRIQVINRDGEIFMAVASAEVDQVRPFYEGILPPGSDEELFEVALNTSKIKGVVGVRVFKEGNHSVGGVPISIKRGQLEPFEEEILKHREPISRFHAGIALSDIFLFVEDDSLEEEIFPVLEILIPLFSMEDDAVSGFAVYFLDGEAIESELQEVDANILTYAGAAFLLGGFLGGGILIWAFRKLKQVNELLQDRTRNLISANHKLSMEARTAAIGAITSHLIHGLKSPLQGIRQFVTTQSDSGDAKGSGDTVWQDAADTTERMQKLINEVIEVLQDRGGGFSYEISASEIASLSEERVQSYAVRKEVVLDIQEEGDLSVVMVGNDKANLIVLILVNLMRNAIDASGQQSVVRLQIDASSSEQLSFKVIDHGPGLSEEVRENLFQPVSSSKEGGSGVGLSLCQELSRHLGGELTLAKTGPEGTIFQLNISTIS